MQTDHTDNPEDEKNEKLDLSSLLNVDFVSRNWEEDRRKTLKEREFRDEPRRDRRPQRDRRAPFSRENKEPGGERFPERRTRDPRGGRSYEEKVEPCVEVQFFPEDQAFNALVKALRQSGQTHELFTLTRLFLEKPERLMIAVQPLEKAGPDARIFICKLDGAAFLTEDEVYQHVFKHHLGEFVETEEVVVEAPKGNFQSVARCPRTKVILCPPNYHLYPQLIQEHQQHYFPGESVDTVRDRLELLREPEAIEGWLKSMTQKVRYRLIRKKKEGKAEKSSEDQALPIEGSTEDHIVKTEGNVAGEEPGAMTDESGEETIESQDAPEVQEEQVDISSETEESEADVQAEKNTGDTDTESEGGAAGSAEESKPDEALYFDTMEELRQWLDKHWRYRIIKTLRQYRISGKAWATFPETPVKESIQHILEEQRRFPLDTANSIRSRFRRLKFELFKHGGRGINYVSPVKRKLKESDIPWSDSVEVLYSQIGRLQPEASIQAVTEAVTGRDFAQFQGSYFEKLDETDKKMYATLVSDLHWLVLEGYVIRFEDGHLEIPKTHSSVKEDEL